MITKSRRPESSTTHNFGHNSIPVPHTQLSNLSVPVLHTQLSDLSVLVLHTQLMEIGPSHIVIEPISVLVLHTHLMDISIYVLHTQLMDKTQYRSFTRNYWTVDKSSPPHVISDLSSMFLTDLRVKLRVYTPTEYYTQHKLEPYEQHIIPFLQYIVQHLIIQSRPKNTNNNNKKG